MWRGCKVSTQLWLATYVQPTPTLIFGDWAEEAKTSRKQSITEQKPWDKAVILNLLLGNKRGNWGNPLCWEMDSHWHIPVEQDILSVQVPFIPQFPQDMVGASQQIWYFNICSNQAARAGREAPALQSYRDVVRITRKRIKFMVTTPRGEVTPAPCLLFHFSQSLP